MNQKTDFHKHLRKLFHSQNLATLSTQQSGQPYASLVAFFAGKDFKHIYFATPNTTRKYANVMAENRVAILINSSTNQVSDFRLATSVTAVGRAAEPNGQKAEAIRKQYLARHPYLADFVNTPTCALIDVTVTSYYMVRNFQDVTELHMSP